jgi:hypothetical protein
VIHPLFHEGWSFISLGIRNVWSAFVADDIVRILVYQTLLARKQYQPRVWCQLKQDNSAQLIPSSLEHGDCKEKIMTLPNGLYCFLCDPLEVRPPEPVTTKLVHFSVHPVYESHVRQPNSGEAIRIPIEPTTFRRMLYTLTSPAMRDGHLANFLDEMMYKYRLFRI